MSGCTPGCPAGYRSGPCSAAGPAPRTTAGSPSRRTGTRTYAPGWPRSPGGAACSSRTWIRAPAIRICPRVPGRSSERPVR
ncbi:hypothetical protein B4N89_04120 [Embleya scabrispora]|uniref:Uncharacterized protein n=1 Tax=Embleya scabrispora TaxID=159449 RepID=A0A1T3NU73_9ACTN|nr:hypothetical protein B4N89_04120 [Embleya scabrispora]